MDLQLDEREYLTLMRRRYCIKIKTIADLLNCSVSLISKYEKGQRTLADNKLKQYMKLINEYQKND